MANFSELVERAKRMEGGAREALLAELRPILVTVIVGRFHRLWDGHADMLEAAEETVLRWLHEDPDLIRPHEISYKLAWRLLAQCGKQYTRNQRHRRKAEYGLREQHKAGQTRNRRLMPFDTRAEELPYEITGSDAAAAIEAMEEPHRSTLLAELDHKLNGGPTLEERFGLSEVAARKRLSRAREALHLHILRKETGES